MRLAYSLLTYESTVCSDVTFHPITPVCTACYLVTFAETVEYLNPSPDVEGVERIYDAAFLRKPVGLKKKKSYNSFYT